MHNAINNFASATEQVFDRLGSRIGGVVPRHAAMIFGENLSVWLRERKLSQIEFARRIGVSQATVSRWADGRCHPSFETLDKIAVALEIPVSDLFRDITDQRTVNPPVVTTDEALQMIIDEALDMLGKKLKPRDRR